MRTHSACQVFGLTWLPCCMQVRWDDQSQHPEVTIESFVGQSSMGLLCPLLFQRSHKTHVLPRPLA